MKILSNFDTKLSYKLVKEWIEKYWEWKSVCIKRHPIYLILNSYSLLLMLIAFIALIYITYFQYIDNVVLMSIFLILYIVTLWQWFFIFSRIFSKKLIHFNMFLDKVNEEDLQHWYFEYFVKLSLALIIIQVIIWISNLILTFFMWVWSQEIMLSISQLIINIFFIYLLFLILQIIFNYEMDFTIVTPKNITYYDQTWFFWRTARTLDTAKIKTISVDKSWLIHSLFNYWDVKILSEWDTRWSWDIQINYVFDPDKVKFSINDIIRDWDNI